MPEKSAKRRRGGSRSGLEVTGGSQLEGRQSGLTGIGVLGLDVGGVLVHRPDGSSGDTAFFGDMPMDTPPVEGALQAVLRLCSVFEQRVYVVSKAGPRVASVTRRWLGAQGFLGELGIPAGNIIFVRRREEKGPVCAALGVTHFVDDRLEVHEALTSVAFRYLFADLPAPLDCCTVETTGVIMVDGWAHAEARIVSDLRRPRE